MSYPSRLSEAEISALPRLVEDRYGLPVAVVGVRCGYMSTVVELDGRDARYILKVYRTEELGPGGRTPGMVAGLRLRSAGLPVPEPVTSLRGEASIQWSARRMVLVPHVRGGPYRPGNRDQLTDAAGMLGRIHAATRSTEPVALAGEADLIEAEVRPVVEAVGRTDAGDPFGTLDLLTACLAKVRDVTPEGVRLPAALIHGDYRAQNLLFDGSRVAAVLDTDGARLAPRLLDLAYACVFFQAVLRDGPLAPAERQAFLEAYCCTIPLEGSELDLLRLWLMLAWMKGTALWLRIAWLDCVNDRAKSWLEAYAPFGRALLRDLEASRL